MFSSCANLLCVMDKTRLKYISDPERSVFFRKDPDFHRYLKNHSRADHYHFYRNLHYQVTYVDAADSCGFEW